MISYNTIFSENLRKFLTQQKMTQAELASKADISKTTVNLILNGKYNPSLELMSKISDILSIPLFMFLIEESGTGSYHQKELPKSRLRPSAEAFFITSVLLRQNVLKPEISEKSATDIETS